MTYSTPTQILADIHENMITQVNTDKGYEIIFKYAPSKQVILPTGNTEATSITLTYNNKKHYQKDSHKAQLAVEDIFLAVATGKNATPNVKKHYTKKLGSLRYSYTKYHQTPEDTRSYIRIGKLELAFNPKTTPKFQLKYDKDCPVNPILSIAVASQKPFTILLK